MPFEKVLEMLRAAGTAAPVRVLCVAHDPMPPIALPGLAAQALDVDLGNAPVDLVVEVRDRDDQLEIAFGYD